MSGRNLICYKPLCQNSLKTEFMTLIGPGISGFRLLLLRYYYWGHKTKMIRFSQMKKSTCFLGKHFPSKVPGGVSSNSKLSVSRRSLLSSAFPGEPFWPSKSEATRGFFLPFESPKEKLPNSKSPDVSNRFYLKTVLLAQYRWFDCNSTKWHILFCISPVILAALEKNISDW